MPKLSDGEKEFNWWMWRGIIVVILLGLFGGGRLMPLPPSSQPDPPRHARR